MMHMRIGFYLAAAVLAILAGRFVYLALQDELAFESDIAALLPRAQDSPQVQEIERRLASELNGRIAVLIQSPDATQTDAATDRFEELLAEGVARGLAIASAGEAEADALQTRVAAMLQYKDRLLADDTRRRLREDPNAQLQRRMRQVTEFPPGNLTSPLDDPFGSLEEFFAERMPRPTGVEFDGLYLRVRGESPANLLLINLAEGALGDDDSNAAVRYILQAKTAVMREFDARVVVSGVALHAAAVKTQLLAEVRWMAAAAALLTLGFFLFVTRSPRGLFISASVILFALAGGLALAHASVGLPHLVGLTMATTAIGICIDFAFHFWVHVRAGMDGRTAIRSIASGLNMSFATTAAALLAITFTAIPVLSRSAVFICGVLLLSWLATKYIVPRWAGKSAAAAIPQFAMPRKIAGGIVAAAALIAVVGLSFNYSTDDSPGRLGYRVESLFDADTEMRAALNLQGDSGIWLLQSESGEALLRAEEKLLSALDAEEARQVTALSRLLPSAEKQRENQALFRQSRAALDAEVLREYLTRLQADDFNWEAAGDEYTLQSAADASWASLERGALLQCEGDVCASMIRARGDAVEKLNAACGQVAECTRVSLLERRLTAFAGLRGSLMRALLLATGAVFVMLFLRYGVRAFALILVPLLAAVSGLAAVAIAGMPITVFSLAAVFPLLGLSIDYVIFASEGNSAATRWAILASAITTTLSFAILLFSTTPAVVFFALPVAVGIPVAWVGVEFVVGLLTPP